MASNRKEMGVPIIEVLESNFSKFMLKVSIDYATF